MKPRVNQPTATTPGGLLRITGHTSEPASVTVNGITTHTTGPQNQYSADIPATSGLNTITATATDHDASPTTKTKTWQLTLNGPATIPDYQFDANGNRSSDQRGSYRYDAENRLTNIIHSGGEVDSFAYDHLSRRISESHSGPGGITAIRHIWDGSHLAETRDSSGGTILTRYHAMGEEQGTTKLHHLTDHLGSVTHLIDPTGTTRAAYTYTPFGERTKASGDLDTAIGYTGHHHHPTGLILTQFRAYDAYSHQWLTRDPIEYVLGQMAETLQDGPNLYSYIGNNSINNVDLYGLDRWVTSTCGHTSIVTEDKDSETGFSKIEFGPAHPLALRGKGSVIVKPAQKPWFLPMKIKSTEEQDKMLLKLAKLMQESPPNYCVIGMNCRHFTSLMKNIGIKNPSLKAGLFPLLGCPFEQP